MTNYKAILYQLNVVKALNSLKKYSITSSLPRCTRCKGGAFCWQSSFQSKRPSRHSLLWDTGRSSCWGACSPTCWRPWAGSPSTGSSRSSPHSSAWPTDRCWGPGASRSCRSRGWARTQSSWCTGSWRTSWSRCCCTAFRWICSWWAFRPGSDLVASWWTHWCLLKWCSECCTRSFRNASSGILSGPSLCWIWDIKYIKGISFKFDTPI